jgi:hypothetical protein
MASVWDLQLELGWIALGAGGWLVVLGSLLIIGLFIFGLGLLLWLWGQVNPFDLPVPDQVVDQFVDIAVAK